MCSFRRFTCFGLVPSGSQIVAIEWPYSRNRMVAFLNM